jgi:hypothetical protein
MTVFGCLRHRTEVPVPVRCLLVLYRGDWRWNGKRASDSLHLGMLLIVLLQLPPFRLTFALRPRTDQSASRLLLGPHLGDGHGAEVERIRARI